MANIIETLGKRYNFPEKQLRILKKLESKNLTARKISKETNIPIGRLYEHLNKLISIGLIERLKGKPALYSFEDKEEKIQNFLKNKFQETTNAEAHILSILSKDSEKIKLITSRGDYVNESRKIYNTEEEIYFIERKMTPPYYFYPEDKDDYHKLRKAISKKRKLILEEKHLEELYKKDYFDNLKKDKRITGITNEKAITDFFKIYEKTLGKEKLKIQVKIIINLLKSSNVHCRLNSQSFPYYMIISKKYILMTFNMPEQITGLSIQNKKTAEQFITFFESIYNQSKDIAPLLKIILKK